MSAVAFLLVQILAVASLPVHVPPPGVLEPSRQLRGGSAPSPASIPSNLTTAPFLGERGPSGHFYYADSCEDCVYKGAQCGCEAAVELFACLTKFCHSANHSKFGATCAEVSTSCSTELDIACRGPDTQCKGKYNQLPAGGIGLTLDLDNVDDDAFCGPFGKCTGVVHMKANVFYPPPQPHVPVSGPAPGPAGGPVTARLGGPAPAPAGAPISLECGLPVVPNADVDNQTHWTLCRAPVIADKAGCDLPMFASLQAGEGKEAYCVLTEGTFGNPPKRLTQPAWHLISNTYQKAHTPQSNTRVLGPAPAPASAPAGSPTGAPAALAGSLAASAGPQ